MESYVGEIRLFGGNFAPAGWHFCDGSLLAISENDLLFNLIGTTYGGDGQSTFAVPDLRGRIPLHQGTLSGGSTYIQGEASGTETVTLTRDQLAGHNHSFNASLNNGSAANVQNNLPAASRTITLYSAAPPVVPMAPSAIGNQGNNEPHENMMPSLTINFIISLYGVWPYQG